MLASPGPPKACKILARNPPIQGAHTQTLNVALSLSLSLCIYIYIESVCVYIYIYMYPLNILLGSRQTGFREDALPGFRPPSRVSDSFLGQAGHPPQTAFTLGLQVIIEILPTLGPKYTKMTYFRLFGAPGLVKSLRFPKTSSTGSFSKNQGP